MAWITPVLPLSLSGGAAIARRTAIARPTAIATTRMSSPTPLPSTPKIAFLGCGNMATAVLSCLLDTSTLSPTHAFASARTRASLDKLGPLGLPPQNLFLDNNALVAAADIVVLGVKPQMAPAVLQSIGAAFDADRQLLISLVAGISTKNHAAALGCDARIVRAIPSMAARIGASATALVSNARASSEDVESALALMNACGSVEVLPDEKMLDAATAALLPTYTYLALEAIADAAVLEGVPRVIARRLAANSLHSAAALAKAQPDVHPAVLRNTAESPGGVTIRATRELERGGYRDIIMEALAKASERSRELNG